MKVLVTGGRGFIGSHLVDRLIKFGCHVTVIDTSLDETYDSHKADYHTLDIGGDKAALLPLFNGVEYVFHLAAESRIQPCILDPELAIKTNIIGTYNVLEAARICVARKVIYSSTSAAYGVKNNPPYREDMPRDCLNPYSLTKCAGEDLCKMYTSLYGLSTTILRYFNVYGERQAVAGSYATVVGIFLDQIKNGEAVTIVGDGNQTRDYVHVSDVVTANMLVMEKRSLLNGEIFNVGIGVSYSVNELVGLMKANKIAYLDPRPGEARHTRANIDKLLSLGWTPQVSLPNWIDQKERYL